METLYEDRELAVIYKPEGLLSVPGKDAAQPSVYALMRRKYQGSYRSAHRPSSGHGNKRTDDYCQDRVCLSSSAKGVSESSGSEEIRSHRLRERQGIVQPDSEEAESGKGYISLPLMADFLDRPRQIVNREQGKEAITEYEVLRAYRRYPSAPGALS